MALSPPHPGDIGLKGEAQGALSVLGTGTVPGSSGEGHGHLVPCRLLSGTTDIRREGPRGSSAEGPALSRDCVNLP